jgi:hypothetical protein
MTNPDPFASYDKVPALSFKDKPIGTSYTGEVLEEARLVQARDFETGERAAWPDGNPKMSAVVRLRVDGEERSLWAPKPSAMFTAIADAQKAAGKRITAGGTLTVTFTGEEPNRKNPRLNAQKLYSAKYTESDAFADDEPPF